jgi:hypothetical protein
MVSREQIIRIGIIEADHFDSVALFNHWRHQIADSLACPALRGSMLEMIFNAHKTLRDYSTKRLLTTDNRPLTVRPLNKDEQAPCG